VSVDLLDDVDQPIPIVTGFLQHLAARGYSPNTLSAYAYDLQHFFRFLAQQDLDYAEFRPPHALLLLAYLRGLPGGDPVQRLSPVLCTTTDGKAGTQLSAPTINRILAAVSSFYEYLILSEQLAGRENPIQIPSPACTA
jgi:site-specific recombinase XerD